MPLETATRPYSYTDETKSVTAQKKPGTPPTAPI